MTSRISATSDPAFQISPAAISPGTDLSGNPLHPRDLAGTGRIADALRVSPDEDDVLRIDRPDYRLKCDQMLNLPGPVAGFLLQLAGRCLGRFLILID